MVPIQENYCLNCDWSASIEDYDQQELANLAIEHHLEYGHNIESIEE